MTNCFRTSSSDPTIAVFVGSFLPPGCVWIYRQVAAESDIKRIVLTWSRCNEEEFPYDPVIVSPRFRFRLQSKVRGKLWRFYSKFSPRLSRRTDRVFVQAIPEYNVKVVHAHYGHVGASIASLCKSLDIPLIITFHGFDATAVPQRWPGYRQMLPRLFEQCEFVIAISEDMKGKLIQLGCSGEKIRVSYLGVPLGDFQFTERASTDKVVFLHAGRLVPKKGVPDLVQAFGRAFRGSENVELMIVGDGPEAPQVRERIRALGLDNCVRMLGAVPSTDMPGIMAKAHVFVLNSRTSHEGNQEGLPITLLEAQASGVPVISTRHSGIPEAVVQGKSAVLVDERDTKGLADAMIEIASRKDQWAAMGRAGRQHVSQVFDLQTCNRRLDELYREAASYC